jgi:uncharacterized membrane protein
MLIQVVEVLARVVDLVGIGVIFWGVGAGLVGFVSAHMQRSKGITVLQAIAQARCKIGTYILFGLEILIASDIAQTIIDPTYENLILLGAIVAIRIILSFFLSRELEAISVRS